MNTISETTVRIARFAVVIAICLVGLSRVAIADDHRVALVIGNAQYDKATALNSPAVDATTVSLKLQNLGFELVGGEAQVNVSLKDMHELLTALQVKLSRSGPDTLAMVYYSGHGVAHEGQNFLIPVDDKQITYRDELSRKAIGVDDLLKTLTARSGGANVVILDACRDNSTLPRIDSTKSFQAKGLVRIEAPPPNTLIVYAAAAGMVAYDGGPDANSPFTSALLKTLDMPIRLWDAVNATADEVKFLTDDKQVPWIGALRAGWKPIFLHGQSNVTPPPPPPPPLVAEHEKAYNDAKKSNTILAYFSVMADFPRTSSATSSRRAINQLVPLHFNKPPARGHQELTELEIRWCLRQEMWIHDFKSVARAEGRVSDFNRRVDDYHSRCGSYSYQGNARVRAENWIDQHGRWIASTRPSW